MPVAKESSPASTPWRPPANEWVGASALGFTPPPPARTPCPPPIGRHLRLDVEPPAAAASSGLPEPIPLKGASHELCCCSRSCGASVRRACGLTSRAVRLRAVDAAYRAHRRCRHLVGP